MKPFTMLSSKQRLKVDLNDRKTHRTGRLISDPMRFILVTSPPDSCKHAQKIVQKFVHTAGPV